MIMPWSQNISMHDRRQTHITRSVYKFAYRSLIMVYLLYILEKRMFDCVRARSKRRQPLLA